MSNTHYPPDAKASALAALVVNEGNVLRTATQLGMPESTLRLWVAGAEGQVRDDLLRLREAKTSALRDRFESIAEATMGVLESKLQDLSPRDAAIVIGIFVDKWRLLSGEATSISGTTANEERRQALRQRYGALHGLTVNVNARSVTLTRDDIEEARKLLHGPDVAPLVVRAHTAPQSDPPAG